jgi:transposase
MRIDKAAEFYGVGKRTVYNWIGRGKVQVKRNPGGSQMVLVDERSWEDPEAGACRDATQ